jgi:hypothetical protein
MDPNSANCRALTNGQANATGRAGFQTADKKNDDASGFNPSDLDNSFAATNAQLNTNTANSFGGGNQAAVVPNNSGGGGGMLAQNGSSSKANLASGRAPAAPAPGVSTDILQGQRSGGYSQGSGFEPETKFRTMRGLASQARARASSYLGLDLKKYLPGGGRDPQRLAGMATAADQINGRSVDLFKTISNKMIEKCKLGILWECQP